MADLLGCSKPTIQAVEYGKLHLSSKLAERYTAETGVSLDWLLGGGKPKQPTVELIGGQFSRKSFEEHRAMRSQAVDLTRSHPLLGTSLSLAFQVQRLCAILSEANNSGRYSLCNFKIESFLQDLEKEFKSDRRIDDQLYFLMYTGGGVPDPVDLTPIVEKYFASLRRHAVMNSKAGRRMPPPISDMPEKPISNDYRVLVVRDKKDPEYMVADGDFFSRQDVMENGLNPLEDLAQRLKGKFGKNG